jgi:transposase InsO family protein
MAGTILRAGRAVEPGSGSSAKVPDLLNRDFTAPAPNLRYVGDITYLPLADGKTVSGHGDRLLLPPPCPLVHRQPHPH